MKIGETTLKKANEAPEYSIAVKLASYSPGKYTLKAEFDNYGIDVSNRSSRCVTYKPPYITDRDGSYSSRMLNDAINAFLTALSDGAPQKENGAECIYCDDGCSFGNDVALRSSHAQAWVKFYDEFSQFCNGLIAIGEDKGKDYLSALIRKETALYNG